MARNCTLLHEILRNIEQGGNLERDLIIAVYGMICIVGLAANGVLLISLLAGGNKGATFKTPSTILILSLAVADTLFLLSLPFSIHQRIQNYWVFGNAACKLVEGIKFLNYYASVFFITAMSIERYYSICRPAAFDRKRARGRLCLISVGIWTLALIAVTPILLFTEISDLGFCTISFPGYKDIFESVLAKNTQRSTNKTFQCLEDYIYSENLDYYYYDHDGKIDFAESYQKSIELQNIETQDSEVPCAHPPVKSLHTWLICNFVIGFVIPFLIISVCYTKIFFFKKSIFFQPHSSTNIQKNETTREFLQAGRISSPGTRDENNQQRAKLLLGVLVPCLILAFSVCWLPYHAWHLALINGITGISAAKCNVIQDITFCLAFFNSALNPILNSFFLLNFKKRILTSTLKFRQVFRRKYTQPSKLLDQVDTRNSGNIAEDPYIEMTVVTSY